MQSVELATLFSQPHPVTGLGVNDLWIGDAVTANGDRRMYIKKLPKRELLSECLCAVIGQELGLDIPQGYLVQDAGSMIGGGLLFGSLDAEMVSIKQWVNRHDPGIVAALTQWTGRYEVALFDEWTANGDRHGGNLLWDGSEKWTLIDHGLAVWSTSDIPDSSRKFGNIIAQLVMDLDKDLAPARLKKESSGFASRCRDIDFEKVPRALMPEKYDMTERCQVALESLRERIEELPILLAHYSDQPDLLS